MREWTICQETGFPAHRGECIIHHGDACLIQVVRLKDYLTMQADLMHKLMEAEGGE